jgi:hypothetical protein
MGWHGRVPRLAWLAALVCIFIATTQPSAAAVRRALLSIQGVGVRAGQSIFRYRIETWGVEFLAVCRVPPQWELKSEKFEDSEGYLSGEADTHIAATRALPDMYLVDVYDYQPVSVQDGNVQHPASFSGWVQVGSREQFGGWHGRRIPLNARNFRLRDASRCPAPPPPTP